MARLDRYLTAQQIALFGFFSLVLVMVYWVNRAVGLFDRLIGDGQSALVFLEFSLLTLPNVVRIVLPVSAFAATVYAFNRMNQDGELVVMQATGFSAVRLARPVLVFGLVVAGMLMFLTHLAVPLSKATLSARSSEIDRNITAQILTDGRFQHPASGITVYIRDIGPTGELRDLFLADDRSPDTRVLYSAPRAVLAESDGAPRLVMFDGTSQTLDRATNRLAVTRFADFTYDLSTLPGGDDSRPDVEDLTTPALWSLDAAAARAMGADRAEVLAELHGRLALPLLGLAAPLLGVAAMLTGGFSRFGLWRQVAGAILLLIGVQALHNAATARALQQADAWPLVYAAPALALAVVGLLLWRAGRPRRRRAAPPDAGEGAAA